MTFLNPLMLFGLAAASLPILIHLLNLRRLRTVEFSSLRFLKELQRTSIRRVRIRQWLLLLLRTLLIVALVLSFSRPALRGTAAGFVGTRATTAMLIILDDSPSMGIRTEHGVAFAQAQSMAEHIIARAREGDEISLTRASDFAHSDRLISFRRQEDAVATLRTLEPTLEHVPFQKIISSGSALLARSTATNKELYLLTDGQKSHWPNADHAGDTSGVGTFDGRMCVIRTDSTSMDNVGIDSVQVLTQIISRDRPVEMRALLRRSGGHTDQRVGVSFYFNGKRVAQQNVAVAPNGVAVAVGRGTATETGLVGGYASIDDDPFEPDNRRFFAFGVPDRIRVLLAEGSPGDGQYVRLGLTLGNDSTLARLFDITPVSGNLLHTTNLENFDVLVACGVASYSPVIAEQIARFVRSGGGLLLFPGPVADLRNYTEVLAPKLGLAAFHRKDSLNKEGGAGFTSFGKRDLAHPLFEGMFDVRSGKERAELPSPVIFSAAAPGSIAGGHAVISLADGTPFLTDIRSGSGRILLFSVDAGGQWSNFPLQGLFAPLLYRAVVYLGRTPEAVQSQWIGQPVSCALHLRGNSGEQTFVLRSPSGVEEKVAPTTALPGGLTRFAASRSTESGVYSLRGRNGKMLSAIPVNIDTSESDLRTADDAEILRSVRSAGVADDRMLLVQAFDQLDAAIDRTRYGVELWRQCAVLALLLALTEMVVGRGAQQGTSGSPPTRSGERREP